MGSRHRPGVAGRRHVPDRRWDLPTTGVPPRQRAVLLQRLVWEYYRNHCRGTSRLRAAADELRQADELNWRDYWTEALSRRPGRADSKGVRNQTQRMAREPILNRQGASSTRPRSSDGLQPVATYLTAARNPGRPRPRVRTGSLDVHASAPRAAERIELSSLVCIAAGADNQRSAVHRSISAGDARASLRVGESQCSVARPEEAEEGVDRLARGEEKTMRVALPTRNPPNRRSGQNLQAKRAVSAAAAAAERHTYLARAARPMPP